MSTNETIYDATPLQWHIDTKADASFLGLPPELREKIYDLLPWDQHIYVVDTKCYHFYIERSRGFQTKLRQTSKTIRSETSARVEGATAQLHVDVEPMYTDDGEELLVKIPKAVVKRIEILRLSCFPVDAFFDRFEGLKEIHFHLMVYNIDPNSTQYSGRRRPEITQHSNVEQVEDYSWKWVLEPLVRHARYGEYFALARYGLSRDVDFKCDIYYLHEFEDTSVGWLVKVDSGVQPPLTVHIARFTGTPLNKWTSTGKCCFDCSKQEFPETKAGWTVELLD